VTHKGQIPILAIVEHDLRQIKLPPMIRPDVPNDSPNEDLVVWGITYYAYCVTAHMQTVLSGLVQVLDSKNVPTALIVARHIFEWTAHACYISRNSETYFKKNEWGRAWHLHSLAMEGNIWIRLHGSKYAPPVLTEGTPEPIGIANVVACYDEYLRQVGKKADAKDTYGLLSEHSHPNSACFNRYCNYVGREVRFVAPSADASLLGEGRYLIDLLIFLDQLLKLGREKIVRKQIIAILTRIAELAKEKNKHEKS
jgi:hypothetical protein